MVTASSPVNISVCHSPESKPMPCFAVTSASSARCSVPTARTAFSLPPFAYNVGYGTLMGNADHPKSRLIQKIESGDRNIHNDYIRFCRYKGKVVPSIRKRRKVELLLLYQK